MEGTARLIEAEPVSEARSFSEITSAIGSALGTNPEVSGGPWVVEVYDTEAIIEEGGAYFRVPYSIAEDGSATLGARTKVERVVSYRVAEARPDPVDHRTPPVVTTAKGISEGVATVLREAPGPGTVFDVLVIQPGTSKNRRRYARSVLESAVSLFEGARSFASDGPDHDPKKRGVKALVGWFTNPRYESAVQLPNGQLAEGVVAEYHVTDAGLAETLRTSIEAGKHDLITFSIVGDGQTVAIQEAGITVANVTRIDSIESVDPVIHAAAGGMAVRLVASMEDPVVNWEKLTLAEAIRALAAGTITPTDLRENRSDLAEAIEKFEETAPAAPAPAPAAPAPAPAAPAAPAPAPVATPVSEAAPAASEAQRIVEAFRTERFTESALAERPGLPERVKARIREAVRDRSMTPEQVTALIEAEADYVAAFAPPAVKGAGAPNVTDMKSEREKIAEGVYDILAGKSRGSIREMYVRLTGDSDLSGRLTESRLTESVTSSTFAEIMGDSITRRMLDFYNLPDLQTWRQIVNVVPVSDFRTQRRTRMGGYGNLPAVAEGQPYNALTSPGDEEATYSVAKKGGTEDLTLETIANDDLGAIRQIPVRLARAASQTLHEFVYDFLKDNGAIYDAVALFHANHSNLGSAALDAAALTAGRTAMLKQTDMSNSKRLSIRPRFLIVPIDLEQTAYELTATDREVASANNTLNFVKTFGLTVIVVEYWTDANNWYLTGDPNLQPTIELGFWNGREEPELFLQDQPTVGSVFSNDKLTYKIRHTYGGAVVDYRPFYGAVVA